VGQRLSGEGIAQFARAKRRNDQSHLLGRFRRRGQNPSDYSTVLALAPVEFLNHAGFRWNSETEWISHAPPWVEPIHLMINGTSGLMGLGQILDGVRVIASALSYSHLEYVAERGNCLILIKDRKDKGQFGRHLTPQGMGLGAITNRIMVNAPIVLHAGEGCPGCNRFSRRQSEVGFSRLSIGVMVGRGP
jgi:hypothetical protein